MVVKRRRVLQGETMWFHDRAAEGCVTNDIAPCPRRRGLRGANDAPLHPRLQVSPSPSGIHVWSEVCCVYEGYDLRRRARRLYEKGGED